jgi:hypothetical protein
MFDVIRFAWFSVRTAFGFIALILCAYAALWLFVKILSMGPGNADPDAALRRVKSYNAQAVRQARPTDRGSSVRSVTRPRSLGLV